MTKNTYEIGGFSVIMTPDAADRWNSGKPTASDLRTSQVHIPDEYRYITLARATNYKLSPEIADMVTGMPANLIRFGKW